MFSNFIAIVKITRPLNCLITFLSIVVAGMICTPAQNYSINILLASTAGLLVTAAGNIINDLFDIEIDRVNCPNRVLPSNKISITIAWGLFITFNLLAIITSSFLNQYSFILVLFSIMVVYAYSYQLKKIPLAGNFVVSVMTAIAFIFGGSAVGNIRDAFIPALFAFLINFIREIVKDMEDIEGDQLNHIETFAIKYGFEKSIKIIILTSVILVLFTFIPFVFRIYKIEYFILVTVFVNVLLVYFNKKLWIDRTKKNLGRMSLLLKVIMVIGLVAIYLGAYF